MAILEMAVFGPVNSAWEAAPFNIAVSTNQQTAFNRLSAVETSKTPIKSAQFWCNSQYFYGDGSVLMIGGGGSSCGDADHGIGITETGAASFIEAGGSATESRGTEYDLYGYNATTGSAPSQSYSLNLWIC